ncbi:hypothetical protein HBH98_253070 [Parastagonospora nodorum]|nr:hypothetical protein HBH53_264100 [Parastagonospora nodorum]KAH3956100.1 hypothetical protein HBH51_255420 [Parastagonospora nodorum]KAH4215347.1 hypothetical protein HBI06_255830 [Parastagonospora nodorum]KAH4222583.1 hypothetical protein HBI05_252800 [Parastagonospora nodorum]KAH4332765.1 hypothetical protein HBH98_253070 [Parastagonospora nodorum]
MNDFVLSQDHVYCGVYDNDYVDITRRAANWLSQIGEQRRNIRKLELKFSTPSWRTMLDLTQLMHQITDDDGSKISITFASTRSQRANMLDSTLLPSPNECLALNDLFSSLAWNCTSQLSTCARSSSSIHYDIRDQTVCFNSRSGTSIFFTRSSSEEHVPDGTGSRGGNTQREGSYLGATHKRCKEGVTLSKVCTLKSMMPIRASLR